MVTRHVTVEEFTCDDCGKVVYHKAPWGGPYRPANWSCPMNLTWLYSDKPKDPKLSPYWHFCEECADKHDRDAEFADGRLSKWKQEE